MAGTAVGAVLFVWAIGALLGGNDTVPAVRGASDGVPPATAAPSSNPPATGRLVVRGSSTSSPSPSSSTAAPTTTTRPTPPPPPQACPDSVLRVTVTSGQPVYQVGDHPRL